MTELKNCLREFAEWMRRHPGKLPRVVVCPNIPKGELFVMSTPDKNQRDGLETYPRPDQVVHVINIGDSE